MKKGELKAVTVIVGLYLILLILYSLSYTNSFDVTIFVHAGDKICKGLDCSKVYLFSESWGYDGFFYWVIAKDPFDLEEISKIYRAPYRYQRILYPLLVYILSFGIGGVIPYTLLFLNLIFILLSFFSFKKLLGESSLAIYYPPFLVGIFVSAILDVAEPMWMFLVLEAFRQHKNGKHMMSSGIFILSALTKETTLLLIGPLILFFLYKKEIRLAVIYSMPVITILFWQLTMYMFFSEIPLFVSVNSGYMFQGLIESLELTNNSPSIHRIPVHILQISAVCALIISISSMRSKLTRYNLMLFVTSLLFFKMKNQLISDIFSASRNALPFTLCLLLYYANSRDGKVHLPLILQVLLSAMVFLYYLFLAL